VIRRGFWLAVGAVTGIYGYRRVSAAGRRLSASLSPAEPGAVLTRTARQGRRTAISAYRFTRDVREGMDLYMARHSEPPDSTLDTNHVPRPKDGH
jgi:hypothetical protein